ncbi:hypothetical protein Tco_1125385 [Tanacetum coccineum]|uniref:Uncharacterized protein n=1 Tax=Tanacetum coccineum TaxID=301880 RepID=A0ABQ5J8U5_9ASTR
MSNILWVDLLVFIKSLRFNVPAGLCTAKEALEHSRSCHNGPRGTSQLQNITAKKNSDKEQWAKIVPLGRTNWMTLSGLSVLQRTKHPSVFASVKLVYGKGMDVIFRWMSRILKPLVSRYLPLLNIDHKELHNLSFFGNPIS